MSTIVTRSGKGSPLTHAEVDANFTNLNTDKYQEGSAIGATTPAAGTFTTLTAQTEVLKGTGQNLVLRSQAWATSPWFNGGLTSITNNTSDVTDPLGGNTATKIVAIGTNSAVGQPLTLIASPQTASVYLRTLSGTATCDLIVYLGAAPFTNIGTVSVTVTSAWQRFSVVTSTATAASYNIQINNISASTIYGWGAQVEIGSTLNTYIPTTTAAVYGTPTLSFSGVAGIGLQSDGSLYETSAGTGNVRFYTNNIAQEQMRVSHTASAVNYVQVTGAATGGNPTISAQGSDSNINLILARKGTGTVQVQGAFQAGTHLFNFLQLAGSTTGNAVTASAGGGDTNIDLTLTPKGTGMVRFGTRTASADAAITGYIEIKDSGGTTRRLAVIG